jgi:hypothetical protein
MLLAIIAAIVWFALNGLLWYAKPSDLLGCSAPRFWG